MINILPTFKHTITLINRLPAQVSESGHDEYYKTVLHNCSLHKTINKNVSDINVGIYSINVCRIVPDERYMTQEQWYLEPKAGYTLSVGDIIIEGDIPDDITDNNALQVYHKYMTKAFKIQYISVNTALDEAFPHIRVEGN